jgi:S1-C subfamily serine protease
MTTSENRDRGISRFFFVQAAIGCGLLLAGAGAAILGDRLFSPPQPQAKTDKSTASLPQTGSPPANSPPAQITPQPAAPAPRPKTDSSNFIVEAIAKVEPAVVRIDAARTVTQLDSPLPPGLFPGLGGIPQERVQQGTGSGFIIDPNGYVLTNSHVVDGTEIVDVTLTDGRRLDGRVLGSDSLTDVAVVKLSATGLPVVPMGDSDRLHPGEWAIAIGNPLGLDSTVTAGIISATGRSSTDVGVPDKRVGFIQTDAAINPGNSGGPLLNADGEVIGMNTAIISGAQGLGFAIPIATVQRVAQQLIATGKAEHPYLGLQMIDLTPQQREQIDRDLNLPFKLKADQGVLVIRIVSGSPADEAGFRLGDFVRKVDQSAVDRADTVQQIVQASKIGKPIAIEIDRNGTILTLLVTPGELPVQD